jgi:hypothetical protein
MSERPVNGPPAGLFWPVGLVTQAGSVCARDAVDGIGELVPQTHLSLGTAPGSVDSSPGRLRPRWKDQHRARAVPAGVPA